MGGPWTFRCGTPSLPEPFSLGGKRRAADLGGNRVSNLISSFCGGTISEPFGQSGIVALTAASGKGELEIPFTLVAEPVVLRLLSTFGFADQLALEIYFLTFVAERVGSREVTVCFDASAYASCN